jgi:hypothetical protein
LISIEDYSDLDTLLELEYEFNQESISGSNSDTDEHENLKPKLSETIEEFDNALWNPQAQLQAQLNAAYLA